MMNPKVCPLAERLAEIPDPRKPKGRRHALAAILCLCIVAMMSGAKTPKGIANWWKNRQGLGSFLERLGFTKSYGPSKSTLYRVLSLVSVEQVEAQVNGWLEELWMQLDPASEASLEPIAMDGKTLRGSRKQGASNTHLLGALSHRLGLIISQMGIDDKTNEIGAMPDFLMNLIIEGRVFTMDALLTQREIAQTIVDQAGDYVMIVKENQPQLHADLEELFAEPGAAPFISDESVRVNKGHGRIERRTLRTSSELAGFSDWPGLQQAFSLQRRTQIRKTGQVRKQTVYGITSLSPHQADALALLTLVRGHWGIENRAHWVRDVTFGEDASQVRKGGLPQVMAALRNCVISLFRLRHIRYIPDGFDFFVARPEEALEMIQC
jgi:predicted transposase YbfD/YdcC